LAKLPDINIDQTLEDIDKELEKKQQLEAPRNYLGMSQIGEECWRKIFYSFRGVAKRVIPASNLKAIEDGYLQEEIMAKRLRLLPYIELHTHDPNNSKEQISFSLLLDHFRGHCDGMILGIKKAPHTWHVWENKAVKIEKFNKIIKSINEYGDKYALEWWDSIYFHQAQIYMHCSETKRHYLTVETPGGRDFISCRTNYNKSISENIITKAKTIIFDNWNIPAKLSEKREFYKCKWCEYSEVCHDGEIPLVNCKTCRYSEPTKNGRRSCLCKESLEKNEFIEINDRGEIKNESLYLDNCPYHIYNPALISAKLIEQQADCCTYIIEENGTKFANCIKTSIPELKDSLDAIYTSLELKNKIKNINNLKPQALKIQQEFSGEIVEDNQKVWNKTYKNGLKG